MDSDNYCSGMRMHRGTNMKEEKFVMRFPSASDAFYSLTCNQNDILYVKLTVLFLQWYMYGKIANLRIKYTSVAHMF